MKKKIHNAIGSLFSAMKRNGTVAIVMMWIDYTIHILLSILIFWLGYKFSPNPLSLFGFIIVYEPITASACALLYFFFGGMITMFFIGDIPMILLGLIYTITREPFEFTIERIEMEKLPPDKKL